MSDTPTRSANTTSSRSAWPRWTSSAPPRTVRAATKLVDIELKIRAVLFCVVKTAGQAAGYVHRRYTETAHGLPFSALGPSRCKSRRCRFPHLTIFLTRASPVKCLFLLGCLQLSSSIHSCPNWRVDSGRLYPRHPRHALPGSGLVSSYIDTLILAQWLADPAGKRFGL